MVVIAAFVVVSLVLPNSAFASDPLPGETTFPLSDFVIIADDKIEVPGNFTVVNGHVCSRNGLIKVGGGKNRAKLPECAPNCDTWNVLSPNASIDCGKNGFIGDARSPVINKSGNCGIFNEDTTNLIPCPDSPGFPAFAAGVADFTCTTLGNDIVPGDYRDLIVEKNGICNFKGPGTYNFRNIIAKNRSRSKLLFESPTGIFDPFERFILNVEGFVLLSENVQFNPTNTGPVFINVEGEDGASFPIGDPPTNSCSDGLDGKGPSAFCHKGDGTLNMCYVNAPNGTCALRGNLPALGQFFCKHFKEVSGLTVKVQLPDADCCINDPECACILALAPNDVTASDDPLATDNRIALRGNNFNSRTVDKVIFVKTNDAGNPATTSIVDVKKPDAGQQDVVCEIARADFASITTDRIDLVIDTAFAASCGIGGGGNTDEFFLGIVVEEGAASLNPCVFTEAAVNITNP